ncbi:hypothetical protein T552_02195 [Pneumocystis carinii B80]|uniref:TPR repeat-containing protein n=1 Tax=Pneumocystis carinii (strain B80) TaxID=1408658 RepID=A0A0W4ZHA6_PNEC8|nr:hypothetical protein T552_02195 [Pneumocystis carinii B80]KTW27755.1 hypothetical protein T552_02195 [Pneumocystis carinii B80]
MTINLKKEDFYMLEWALLKGENININIGIERLIQLVIDGDFKTVFLSSEIQRIFKKSYKDVNIIQEPGPHKLKKYIEDRISDNPPTLEGELHLLLLAISSIHVFIQIHFTGPKPVFDSYILLPDEWKMGYSELQLNKDALKCLEIGSAYPYHLMQYSIFLLISKIILSKTFKYSKTCFWWKARVDFMHQRILDEKVAILHDCIFENMEKMKIECKKHESHVYACYLLELELCLSYYGQNSKALDTIKDASKKTGLKWVLTGILGRRTKFQTFDTSQLVLIAKGNEEVEEIQKGNQKIPKTLDLNDDTLLETISFKSGKIVSSEYHQDSCIPRSLEDIDPNDPPSLNPLDSCILLALTLLIKNTNPNDGLTMEEMASYIDRVLKHPRNWTVHSMALFIRSELEITKGRTMERSILQLQVLVDQLLDDIDCSEDMPKNTSFLRKPHSYEESASTKQRLMYVWQLLLLPRWAIEEELANRYMSIGIIRSALEIFERLQMWEKIAICWNALDKKDKAIDVLVSQLAIEPKNPKILTLLGDIEQNPDHWIKAWNVSGNRYAKAQKSLGMFYYSRQEFEKSAEALKLSLDINSLNYSAWFTYGCCHLKLSNWQIASEAFTRCVSLDPSDGESWNNLSLSFLKYDPPRKQDAWNALKQALSSCYESWRIWENYLTLSLDMLEWNEVIRSMRRCIELRGEKLGENVIDIKILEILVHEVTKNEYTGDEKGFIKNSIELITNIIPPLITSKPELWSLVAKINIWRKNPSDALEAYIKSYNIWTSKANINTNRDVWIGTVKSAMELVDAYETFGSMKDHMGNLIMPDWKFKAKSILRTLKGKGQMSWSESEEFNRITESLEKLNK